MQKIKNFKQLIGKFEESEDERPYRTIEKKFLLKRKYTERDWLT